MNCVKSEITGVFCESNESKIESNFAMFNKINKAL